MLQHWSCVFGLFKKDNGKPVVNHFFSFLYIYPSTRGSLSSIYVSFIFLTLSIYLSFPLSLPPLFLTLHLSIYVYKYLSMKPVKVTRTVFPEFPAWSRVERRGGHGGGGGGGGRGQLRRRLPALHGQPGRLWPYQGKKWCLNNRTPHSIRHSLHNILARSVIPAPHSESFKENIFWFMCLPLMANICAKIMF